MEDTNITGLADDMGSVEDPKDECCDGGTCECGGEKSACGCTE